MKVLALSSPIYAHTANAAPFLTALADRGAEVHWGLDAGLGRHAPATPAQRWDTGPAPTFTARGGRLREVSHRYAWLLNDAAARLAPSRALLERLRPDVVLTDSLGYAAALAAERAGLPWVSFGDGPLHFPDERTPPFGAGLPYRTPAPWVWRNHVVQAASRGLVMRRAQHTYDQLRDDLGLRPGTTPLLEAALSPVLHLHCGTPELEYPRRDLPDHVHFVGALRPPTPHAWQRPGWWDEVVRPGRPLVLATQGTLRSDPAELLAPTRTALRRLDLGGVLTTGGGDAAALGGPGLVGPGVAVESFVPYEQVLPHACALVTNGGWTGVLLALAHGVPVLQVGRTEEKADIGRRVQWAGAGRHLASPGRPDDPRALVRSLSRLIRNPGYRDGARAVARSLADRDPGRDGARLIASLVQGATPPPLGYPFRTLDKP